MQSTARRFASTAIRVADARALALAKQRAGIAWEFGVNLPEPLAASVLSGQAQEHPHDGDDPGNDWVFGKRAELFHLELLGTVDAPSGYVAVARSDDESDLADASEPWDRLQESLKRVPGIAASHSGPGADVRAMGAAWVGRVLGASRVAVYVAPKRKAGEARGLTIQALPIDDE